MLYSNWDIPSHNYVKRRNRFVQGIDCKGLLLETSVGLSPWPKVVFDPLESKL